MKVDCSHVSFQFGVCLCVFASNICSSARCTTGMLGPLGACERYERGGDLQLGIVQ